jgi:carbamate kinase
MKVVIAIGGNSLVKDSKSISAKDQMHQIMESSKVIASIASEGHDMVITHGNGPQVGYLLRMSELAEHEIPLFPLDYCVANTQGSIGYQLQHALYNLFHQSGINRAVATLVTQTVVNQDDPAFLSPSKPIGSFFDQQSIEEHAEKLGWKYVEDSGRGYRRVVASPIPTEIIEKEIIENMLKNHTVVITVGGGGIPVVKQAGILKGTEAVIDKDLASSLLAREINADLFIISTAVSNAYINFNQANQKALEEISTHEIKSYLSQGFFGKGSMEPKIKAAIDFTEKTKKTSIITSPENIHEAILGKKGTRIIYEEKSGVL